MFVSDRLGWGEPEALECSEVPDLSKTYQGTLCEVMRTS